MAKRISRYLKYCVITLILSLPLIVAFLLIIDLDFIQSSITLMLSFTYVYILINAVSVNNFILNGKSFFDSFINFCKVIMVINLVITDNVNSIYNKISVFCLNYGLSFDFIYKTTELVKFLGLVGLIVASILVVRKGKANKYCVAIILMILVSVYNFITILIYNMAYSIDIHSMVYSMYIGGFSDYPNSVVYYLPSLILWIYIGFKYNMYSRNKTDDYLNRVSYLTYVGAIYQITYTIIFCFLSLLFAVIAI